MDSGIRRYMLEFWGAMLAYGVVVFGSTMLLSREADAGGLWRTPLALAPMVPAAAVLMVVVRQLGCMDELQRRIQFQALAFAFGGTALATFSYGFLEASAGYPHVPWFWVWPIMASLWLVGLWLAKRRYQ